VKKIVGLTGVSGIGTDLIIRFLRLSGYYVIEANNIAHKCLYISEIKNCMIDEVIVDNKVNRKLLGNVCFENADEMSVWNVMKERFYNILDKDIELISAKTDKDIIFLNCSAMFETGINSKCNKIVWINNPLQDFMQNLSEKGYSMPAIQGIFKRIIPERFNFKNKAHYTINVDNDILISSKVIMRTIIKDVLKENVNEG